MQKEEIVKANSGQLTMTRVIVYSIVYLMYIGAVLVCLTTDLHT